jgi:hypothetical protein
MMFVHTIGIPEGEDWGKGRRGIFFVYTGLYFPVLASSGHRSSFLRKHCARWPPRKKNQSQIAKNQT